MVMQTGTITNTGTVLFTNLTRYEHHKIDVIVSDYVSPITLKIEDVSNNEGIPINLEPDNKSFTLSSNGGEGFVIENMRLEKIRVNVSSGTGNMRVNYEGW